MDMYAEYIPNQEKIAQQAISHSHLKVEPIKSELKLDVTPVTSNGSVNMNGEEMTKLEPMESENPYKLVNGSTDHCVNELEC